MNDLPRGMSEEVVLLCSLGVTKTLLAHARKDGAPTEDLEREEAFFEQQLADLERAK